MPGDNSNNLTSAPLPQPGHNPYAPGQEPSGYTQDPRSWNYDQGSQTMGYTQGFNPQESLNGGDKNFPVASGQNYAGIYNRAQGMTDYFNGLASNYNQTAPTIGDASQLGVAQNYYQGLMNGDAGYAAKQYQQSQDQAIAAQMAMANSARGGAASLAGAQRAATQGAGAQMATAANQAGQIAAQEEQMGAQGMQGIGQLELQRLSNNAQLQQNNQQQINQMQQALYGMGEQEQGLGLSTQQAYMANLLAAEGINTQQSQFNTQLGMQAAGAGLQTLGAIGSAAASDERFKTDINPQGITSAYSHSLTPAGLSAAPPPSAGQAAGQAAGMGAATGALSGLASGGFGGAALGAATGAARGAAQSGLASMAQQHPDDENAKVAGAAGQALAGAGAGALGGSVAGPIGTGIGAVVGGIGGLLKGLL